MDIMYDENARPDELPPAVFGDEHRLRDMERRITALENRLENRLEQSGLEAEGYVRQRPPVRSRLFVQGPDEDAKVCHETRCDSCGHVGMDYEPWWNEQARSYRAFAVCPRCHHREEI